MPISPEGDYYDDPPQEAIAGRWPGTRDDALAHLMARARARGGRNYPTSTRAISKAISRPLNTTRKALERWPDLFVPKPRGRHLYWTLAPGPAADALQDADPSWTPNR